MRYHYTRGVVVAGALMASGSPAEDAIEAVRRGRGVDVPKTRQQCEWLRQELADSLALVNR